MNGKLPAEMRAVVTPEAIERFWARVDKTGPCWIWTGGRNSEGYGHSTFKQVDVSAHRMAYFLERGPIPDGLQLDHLCRVRHCVNPDHLEPVPMRVNLLRGISPWAINKRKTHCKHGHEFTPETTVIYVRDGKEHRECRACWPLKYRRSARGRKAAS